MNVYSVSISQSKKGKQILENVVEEGGYTFKAIEFFANCHLDGLANGDTPFINIYDQS